MRCSCPIDRHGRSRSALTSRGCVRRDAPTPASARIVGMSRLVAPLPQATAYQRSARCACAPRTPSVPTSPLTATGTHPPTHGEPTAWAQPLGVSVSRKTLGSQQHAPLSMLLCSTTRHASHLDRAGTGPLLLPQEEVGSSAEPEKVRSPRRESEAVSQPHITVTGGHFLQEDSPPELTAAILVAIG